MTVLFCCCENHHSQVDVEPVFSALSDGPPPSDDAPVEGKLSTKSGISTMSYGFYDWESGITSLPDRPRSRAGTASRAVACERVEEEEAEVGAGSVPKLAPRSAGLLGHTLWRFQVATNERSADNRIDEVQRMPFVEGLEAFASALDLIAAGLGSHLKINIDKLSRLKASAMDAGYRQWLLSELPVHAASSYKSFVEDSAWTAHLWIGRILGFWAEFFAEFNDGRETASCASLSYKRTLANHHNPSQRGAFNTVVGWMPARGQLLRSLEGTSTAEVDVVADLVEFVTMGRLLADYCLRVAVDLSERLSQERVGV